MRTDQSTTFTLAKSILAACDTQEDLQNAVRFLKSERECRSLVEALESFLEDQSGTPRVERAAGEQHGDRKREETQVNMVMLLLREKGMSANDLQMLIRDRFGVSVPVNKMGLRRYVDLLSHKPFFEELCKHLLSLAEKEQDSWMKEMLLHTKNAHG